MRRMIWLGILGLALAPASVWADDKAPTCSAHGTKIDFYDTPSQAATQALKAEKLVLVLHVSGHFEDPRLT
jgi:hypothetical protein